MADPQRRHRSVLGPIAAATLTIASLSLPRRAAAAGRCRRGAAGSTSTGTACLRSRRAGCGVRPPASRSCATSSTWSPTTQRAAQRRFFAWMRLAQPVSPAALRRRRSPGLGRRVAPLRRRSLPARRQHDVRRRASLRRATAAPDQPARRADRVAWEPRLDPYRVQRDGRPADHSVVPVTSVRVTGPLYGLQSRNGYDMPPDAKLTPSPAAAVLHALAYAPIRWPGTTATCRSSRCRQSSRPSRRPGEPAVSARYAPVQGRSLRLTHHPAGTQGRDRRSRPTGKEIGP